MFRSAFIRAIHSSPVRRNRAIIYRQNGEPKSVLEALTYPSLRPPPPNTLNLKVLLSPINPADVNVIEGVYPQKPSRSKLTAEDEGAYIGGNEGLAMVTAVGEGVEEFKKHDWVLVTKQQSGFWCSAKNVHADEVLKVPMKQGLSKVHAATMSVNPATAYNMLHEFVELKAGDWVVQNGANSAVGQAVIQIAASRGLKTLNFVRDREDLLSLSEYLKSLGATHVATYDQLADKSFKHQVKSWIDGKPISLGLNCVSGPETTAMARLLSQNAHLVSYGAMSKKPLSLPTSLFIFKNLTCHGYWQGRWYQQKSKTERQELVQKLVELMTSGKFKEPAHKIVKIPKAESDADATDKIRALMEKISEGRYGKKVLLEID